MNYRSDRFRAINSNNPNDYTNGFLEYFEAPKDIEKAREMRLSYTPIFTKYLEQYKVNNMPLDPIVEQPVSTRVAKPLIFPSKKSGGRLVSRNPIERFKQKYKKGGSLPPRFRSQVCRK